MHTDYLYLVNRHEPATLTPAGRFWFAYMLGANSAIAYVLVCGYRDAIRQAVGL